MGIYFRPSPAANFTPPMEVREDTDHWRNLFRFLQLPTQEVEKLIEKLRKGFHYLEENAENTKFTTLVPIDINGREIRFGVYFNTQRYRGFENKRDDWISIRADLTATVTRRVYNPGTVLLDAVILVSESIDIESLADTKKFITRAWLKWNFLELLLRHKLDESEGIRSFQNI